MNRARTRDRRYGGFPINLKLRFSLRFPTIVPVAFCQSPTRRLRRAVSDSGAIGNARAWEERDPHSPLRVAVHGFSTDVRRQEKGWNDGRTHPPVYEPPHSWMGFSTGRFVGNAPEGSHHPPPEQGGLRRERDWPRAQSGDTPRPPVRHEALSRIQPSSTISRSHLTEPLAQERTNFYLIANRLRELAVPMRRRGAGSGPRARRTVPNYAFGQNPFVREYTAKELASRASGGSGYVAT